MSKIFDLNDTSKSIDIEVYNDEGQPTTGLVAATFPSLTYSKAGPNADVAIVLSDLAAITDAWASGGLKERGNGIYRLDVPNTVFTTLNSKVTIRGGSAGKWLIPVLIEVSPQLTNTNIGGITGGGTGARTVVVTVQTSGAVAIDGARVRMTKGAESFTQTTNASGQCTFNLDDGTWTVGITAAGYSFAGTTLVVDGAESPTYTMTTNSITPADDPAFCILAIRVWGTNGSVAVGAEVKAKVVAPPTGEGELFNSSEMTEDTGADGYASFTVPRGCSVKYWVGNTEKKIDAVGTDSDVEYVDNHIGIPS